MPDFVSNIYRILDGRNLIIIFSKRYVVLLGWYTCFMIKLLRCYYIIIAILYVDLHVRNRSIQ